MIGYNILRKMPDTHDMNILGRKKRKRMLSRRVCVAERVCHIHVLLQQSVENCQYLSDLCSIVYESGVLLGWHNITLKAHIRFGI